MTRTPLIAGNWKMFNTHLEAIKLIQQLGYELADHDFRAVEVAICPPFTSLRTAQTLMEDDRLSFALGAQNMHWEHDGAFTGEVSAPMLKALRVRYVILGHSERREHLGETDDDVNRKVKAAFRSDLVPIMCCGETESEREQGATRPKVERQVRAGLAGLKPEQVRTAVIAYEPIWAIGTGKTATPEIAQEAHAFVKSVLDVPVLYGGSVKPENAEELLVQADVDGALVGGASLEVESFTAICETAARLI